jgi:membrane protein implicated in regulation of membrane protease activity
MRTIIGWGSASIAGSAAWWLGRHVGLWLAIILSAIASGAGLYYGYRWFDQNLK